MLLKLYAKQISKKEKSNYMEPIKRIIWIIIAKTTEMA